MEVHEAFQTLLARLQEALRGAQQAAEKALREGDFTGAKIATERCEEIANQIEHLETLQGQWPALVHGLAEKPVKRTTQRLPRGVKTPNDAFWVPILRALEQMGGRGRMGEVLTRVGVLMQDQLNEADFGLLSNGRTIRWHNTVAWARLRMVKAGLLASDSPRGIWEITERGRAYLRQHGGDVGEREISVQQDDTPPPTISAKGIPIFVQYRGRRYEATLLPTHQVLYNGKIYSSPSAAAKSIVDWQAVNGWKFWNYVDQEGRERCIDRLRREPLR